MKASVPNLVETEGVWLRGLANVVQLHVLTSPVDSYNIILVFLFGLWLGVLLASLRTLSMLFLVRNRSPVIVRVRVSTQAINGSARILLFWS